ncbi:GTP cyclohydrolase FolE2 [Virgibacillus sp. W0430]|uniref:GTP cyclohydrolase FolE2 n=1 Tax=Virgibacillus sp. W0430 TaxID=3391580 RepID=UPI003F46517B
MNNIKSLQASSRLPAKEERHKLFGSVEPGPRTKPTTKEDMSDLQNVKKDFLFNIDAVGIANVKHPIVVKSDTKPKIQTTIGTFQLTSNVNKSSKGTNMSRFLEEINEAGHSELMIDFPSLKQFVLRLRQRLEHDEVKINIAFPWFYERKGPNSQLAGMNHADVSLNVVYNENTGFKWEASLSVYVTTLCPCSKEISEYSAHSQRGRVTMEVVFTDDIVDEQVDWKKQLLHAAESNASSKIHPVLKRPDEKIVTEAAYENPRFVEDMVRLVAADLYELPFVEKFKVSCQNEESIHMHDAIATISFNKLEDIPGEVK